MAGDGTNFGTSKSLTPSEREALADFVAGAGGTKIAFVEKKFVGDKAGEVGRAAKFSFERAKVMMAFAARQRDMRLKATSLWDKAAGLGGRGDTFMKQEQLGREPNAGKENSRALKAAHLLQANRYGWRMQRTQARDYAGVLFRAGIAQKLQGDVPGFRRGPTEAARGGAKPRLGRAEFVNHRDGQRDSDKEAHGDYFGSTGLGSVERINSAR